MKKMNKMSITMVSVFLLLCVAATFMATAPRNEERRILEIAKENTVEDQQMAVYVSQKDYELVTKYMEDNEPTTAWEGVSYFYELSEGYQLSYWPSEEQIVFYKDEEDGSRHMVCKLINTL